MVQHLSEKLQKNQKSVWIFVENKKRTKKYSEFQANNGEFRKNLVWIWRQAEISLQ